MLLCDVRKKYGAEFVPKVEAELRKLATAHPDLRYSLGRDSDDKCFYDRPATGDDTPGCIFGQALFAMGWDDKEERKGEYPISLLPGIEIVPYAWSRVQRCQDSGGTWSEAVAMLGVPCNSGGASAE